jgi:hypothetical protein
MTYNEFICECVCTIGAVITETGRSAFTPQACFTRALTLGEILLKEGFISVPFELLEKKLNIYQEALQTALNTKTNETDKELFYGESTPRIDPGKLIEMTKTIERLIEVKNDFYAFANVAIRDLIKEARKFEERKPGADRGISPAAERILCFFESRVFGYKEAEREEVLLDTLEWHKDDSMDGFGVHARKIREALVASQVAERCFIDQLGSAWKTVRGAKEPPESPTRHKKSAKRQSEP